MMAKSNLPPDQIQKQRKRPAGPWLVSSLIPVNLFEPRIAKRFEAGAEEDRAVAQAKKLGCRLAPPSHLRLVKPNRIQRKMYPTNSAHNKHVSNAGHPRKSQMRADSSL